jgi:hypothetical protein
MDTVRPLCRNEGTFVMRAYELRRHPHPNPYYHLDPMHIAKSERLSEHLKEMDYTLRHINYRLEAAISQETWMKRDRDEEISIGFGRELRYTRLKFRDNGSSEVHITEGLAFLDFARSRSGEESWVVVDVFVVDDSYIKMTANHVKHKAACRILDPAAESGNPRLKQMDSLLLGKQHYKELIHVRNIKALADAFALLTKLEFECLWPRLNMAMFSDIRKCWCFEVSPPNVTMRMG